MIKGIYMSNQGIVGDRAGDFASAILQLYPTGTAMMLALSSGMNKASAKDTIFHWFEDSHQSGRTTTASGGTGTTVVVGDGGIYVPNQVLMVEETGEIILVSSIAGNSLTVIRAINGGSPVSITNSMHVQSIGNAHEEASSRPTAITQQGSPRMNYTQIFRNAWAVSGTAKAVDYRTGNKVAHNKKTCAMYHAEDMERAIVWGKSAVTTLNGKPFRLTDGIVSQITKYGGTVEAATDGSTAGNYSRRLFDDFMRRVFSTNVKGQPNERIAFCGDMVLQVIQNMTYLDSSYEIGVGEEVLGIMVTTVQTPFGKLKLMTHPLMNESPLWQYDLYVLHPGGIRRRMLRETQEEGYDSNGRRIDGQDADEGILTTEMGMEVGAASTMGILTNVRNAVKSFA